MVELLINWRLCFKLWPQDEKCIDSKDIVSAVQTVKKSDDDSNDNDNDDDDNDDTNDDDDKNFIMMMITVRAVFIPGT